MAKEQKLRAFTSRLCKSQGCFLCEVVSSIGSIVEKSASSDSRSCHTSSLLSRPCLVKCQHSFNELIGLTNERT
jgi:hypothetical protein